jgi:tetratricopeptide (TPR) repeat protein
MSADVKKFAAFEIVILSCIFAFAGCKPNPESVTTEDSSKTSLLATGDLEALTDLAEDAIENRDYLEALSLFKRILAVTSDKFGAYKGLATASAGIGDASAAIEYTENCYELNMKQTEYSIVEISTPFWHSPAYYQEGITYYEAIDKLLPNRPWIQQNIDTLNARLKQ